MSKETRKQTHGWFHTPSRPGDRTLDQQLIGLEPLFAEVAGKTVLDVGCAEGLISVECAKRGASFVRGVELVESHLAIADPLGEAYPCKFTRADANEWEPDRMYDVVLLLAILHKLKDPSSACVTLARVAESLCVIRYPSSSEREVIVDVRSRRQPHDIGDVMATLGFSVERVTSGPFDEQTYFYRR